MGFGNKQLKLEKTPSKQRAIFILKSQGNFPKVNNLNRVKNNKNHLEFKN